MSKRKAQGYVAAALMLLNLPVVAEDIDLFAPRPPDEDTGRPQVLLIVDNTANWNTAFVNEKAALVKTFNGLPLDRFDVGIMFFGSPDTGYVRAAMRPMNAVNRPLYSAMINNLHVSNDRGNARTLARTFSEAHRYLRGLETVDAAATTGSPHNTKRDYRLNTAGNIHDDRVHARPGNALDSNDRDPVQQSRSIPTTASARTSSTSATPCRAATSSGTTPHATRPRGQSW